MQSCWTDGMVYKHYRWALGGLKPKSNISRWTKPGRNQLARIQWCVHMKPNMIKLLCAPCVHWKWVIEARTERWLQYVNIIHPRTAYCWPFLDQLADTFNRKAHTHTHSYTQKEREIERKLGRQPRSYIIDPYSFQNTAERCAGAKEPPPQTHAHNLCPSLEINLTSIH